MRVLHAVRGIDSLLPPAAAGISDRLEDEMVVVTGTSCSIDDESSSDFCRIGLERAFQWLEFDRHTDRVPGSALEEITDTQRSKIPWTEKRSRSRESSFVLSFDPGWYSMDGRVTASVMVEVA